MFDTDGKRLLRHVSMASGQGLRAGDRVEVTLDVETSSNGKTEKKSATLTEALDAIQVCFQISFSAFVCMLLISCFGSC